MKSHSANEEYYEDLVDSMQKRITTLENHVTDIAYLVNRLSKIVEKMAGEYQRK